MQVFFNHVKRGGGRRAGTFSKKGRNAIEIGMRTPLKPDAFSEHVKTQWMTQVVGDAREAGLDRSAADALHNLKIAVPELPGRLDHRAFAPVVPRADLNQG